jgi:RNA polymerase sigma-70 factor (ECF subfamily)
VRAAVVNGAAGAIVGPVGRPMAVIGFIVADGRIHQIDIVVDRRKLTHIGSGNG